MCVCTGHNMSFTNMFPVCYMRTFVFKKSRPTFEISSICSNSVKQALVLTTLNQQPSFFILLKSCFIKLSLAGLFDAELSFETFHIKLFITTTAK